MQDVMLDLETFGTRPGCVIRSIGAVFFDLKGNTGAEFYVNLDKQSCLDAGLFIDPATEAWWASQSKAARDALLTNPVPLADGLREFAAWFRQNGGVRVWSQGANFDEPLIQVAAHAARVPMPWKFWDSRCTRTFYEGCGFDPRTLPRAGTYHNALDDAKYQVACVQAARAKVVGKTKSEEGVLS